VYLLDQAVEHPDGMPAGEEMVGEMRADESSSSGD
jgi:hypothetical protein